MARLEGPRIPGIPCDADGFVAVDGHCSVLGFEDVYAAGDMTSFPIKHGGLATQQADAAAYMIASNIGTQIEPTPFQPVLRGQLLTGMFPRYLRLDATPTATHSVPRLHGGLLRRSSVVPHAVPHERAGTCANQSAGRAEGDDKVIEWQSGGWAPV